MTTRRPASRAVRPEAEGLESRALLAKVLTGIDADGDAWTLRLLGPGDLRVVNQVGADELPIPLGEPAQIQSITVGGTDPLHSRLVGVVNSSAQGDGKVFFEALQSLGGRALGVTANNGIYAIDAPDFWLGRTSTAAPTAGTPAGAIDIPDGIVTLRFGGVDATFTPEGGTPLRSGLTDTNFAVNLGLPRTIGTSIIVDQVISDAGPGRPIGGEPGDPIQVEVNFLVRGRINLFQADEIRGSTEFPPSTPFLNGGGTHVFSIPDNVTTETPEGTGVTGQIGFVRVGNNATNFSVQTNDRISNFFIGGETENVFLLAPEGSRNVYFGKGMDTTTILTHVIMSLQANRGALNSEVISNREIGQVIIGGDMVNTRILSGHQRNLDRIFQTQDLGTVEEPAQPGGSIRNILIAGDVKDSIIAASVEPFLGSYAVPEALILPGGRITAKVEGNIDNATIQPTEPGRAFFAEHKEVVQGPVTPPDVPEAPYPNPGAPPTGPRVVHNLLPTGSRQAAAAAHLIGTAVPRGPAGTNRSR